MTDEELQYHYLSRPPRKRRSFFWQIMNIAAWAVYILLPVALLLRFAPDLLVGYGIVSAERMCAFVVVYCQATTTTTTPAQPPAQPPIVVPGGGGGGGGGGGSAPQPISVGAPLPSCSTVADTTTACTGAYAQEAQPAPAPLPYCEDVPPGTGISACQWRDAEAARQLQQQTEQQSLQLWTDMADQAVEQDLRAPATTPTAQVPTECENPPNDRARAACELIKRGIIHPKG